MELSGIGMQRFSECMDKPNLTNNSQKDKSMLSTKDMNEIRGSGSTIVKGEFSDLFFVQNHKTEVDLTKVYINLVRSSIKNYPLNYAFVLEFGSCHCIWIAKSRKVTCIIVSSV